MDNDNLVNTNKEIIVANLRDISNCVVGYKNTSNDLQSINAQLSAALNHLLNLFGKEGDRRPVIDQFEGISGAKLVYEDHQKEVGRALAGDDGLFKIIFENQALVKESIKDLSRERARHNNTIDVTQYYKDFCARFGQFNKILYR